MIKPEFRSYRMFWKFCLQLQGIGQPDCSTSKDIWSMLQGGSVFRYQPVDQQITARTVAAPATHRPIDLFLSMLSRSLPTQRLREENSQIRLRIDVTKWDGKGKLSKATRIVQHCGSTTKRSSEIKKQPSGYCFIMPMPVCQKPDKTFFRIFRQLPGRLSAAEEGSRSPPLLIGRAK